MGCDVPVDSESLLVTDFVNLKIKSIQSFRCIHKGGMYVRMFIGVIGYTYISIYIFTMFLKKSLASSFAQGVICVQVFFDPPLVNIVEESLLMSDA
jgi:hypothetical protein